MSKEQSKRPIPERKVIRPGDINTNSQVPKMKNPPSPPPRKK